LIRAYLKARHETYQQRMENELAQRFATPKERLIGAFEIQGQSFTDPDFHQGSGKVVWDLGRWVSDTPGR
jgi:hypothetical protein